MNQPSHDQVFEALSNAYRRRLLLALLEANPHADGAGPAGIPNGLDGASGVHRAELKHVHLPKLDDVGFVDWNRENDEAGRGSNWEGIAPFLRTIEDHRDELTGGAS